MSAHADRNVAIIEEFRGNDGVVGGYFTGVPILLVHHVGAKTGTERIAPMAYQAVGQHFAVFASKGGSDDNPAWYYNILANPQVTVEVGTETIHVTAREAIGPERDRIWARQTADYPTFATYERKTSRAFIPVIVLERS